MSLENTARVPAPAADEYSGDLRKTAIEGASCTSTSKGSTLAIPGACKGLNL